MEIKATLKKPYTEKQRLDFIVDQNHNKGYEIKETEAALEAWGYSASENEERKRAEYKRMLIDTLDSLDLKCIRSLRAVQAGTATKEDKENLKSLEEEAKKLREQIKSI